MLHAITPTLTPIPHFTFNAPHELSFCTLYSGAASDYLVCPFLETRWNLGAYGGQ